jgi:hypothetical protein
MNDSKNLVIASFKDILEFMLPTLTFSEDVILPYDSSAIKSHGLESKINDEGNIILEAGSYSNDYYNDTYTGFFCITENGNKKKIHLGVDISYGYDCPLSCIHAPVYSPVTGVIEKVDNLNRTITIKSKYHLKKINGKKVFVFYYHILKNFDIIYGNSKNVFAGETCLGTIGGYKKDDRYGYPQHVHYEIKMPLQFFTGNYICNDEKEKVNNETKEEQYIYINPEKFWNFGIEEGIEEFKVIEKEEEIEKEATENNETIESEEESSEDIDDLEEENDIVSNEEISEEVEEPKENNFEIDEDGFIILK